MTIFCNNFHDRFVMYIHSLKHFHCSLNRIFDALAFKTCDILIQFSYVNNEYLFSIFDNLQFVQSAVKEGSWLYRIP